MRVCLREEARWGCLRAVALLVSGVLALILPGQAGGEERLLSGQVPTLHFVRGLEKEGSIPEMGRVDGSIGYLRIRFFGRRTARRLRQALRQFQAEGMEGLLIDLRDNEGGYLRSAVEALDCFTPPGVTLLEEVDRRGKRIRYISQDDFAWEKPVALLVNERSASSAEAFAGSLRYHGRAILVGKPTFGKKVVETVTPLPAHERRFTTTGIYTLPDGTSIGPSGLRPDFLAPTDEELPGLAVERLKEVIGKTS